MWVDNYMSNAAATVETYNLKASNGRHIRKATKVTFADGRTVSFIEKMSKQRAIQQAQLQLLSDEIGWQAAVAQLGY
jgi:ABC-type Zn2+ transport system substrate-binding protein/surface adhesin